MDVEAAYLSHLALVESWSFDSGRLVLTTVSDDRVYRHLLFESAQPANIDQHSVPNPVARHSLSSQKRGETRRRPPDCLRPAQSQVFQSSSS